MTSLSDKMSAYLDGELSDAETQEIEAWIETDPDAQAQFDRLIQADTLARDVFEAQLNDPVPFALAQSIKATPMPEARPLTTGTTTTPAPANTNRPLWASLAAGLAMLMIGGLGGYWIKGQTAPVQTAGWLQDIADYHAVYASQGRHLVEVSADEADHIETWLGNTIGASFTIPDLSTHGLTFEGGRLLVANGAPVAQLMYRDAAGDVIALCLQRNGTNTASDGFKTQTINAFEFISWRSTDAAYVVIGPQNTTTLQGIAETAALEI